MLQCSQVGRSSSMEGPCLLRNETDPFYVVETLGSMARRNLFPPWRSPEYSVPRISDATGSERLRGDQRITC